MDSYQAEYREFIPFVAPYEAPEQEEAKKDGKDAKKDSKDAKKDGKEAKEKGKKAAQ